jgi:hypothetical protein
VKRATFITSSWDDGHPLDLRVAEMLGKYGLRGTFYVPMMAETETMLTFQIRQLAQAFEVGAHTLYHTVLTSANKQDAWEEIIGSKAWVEDITGQPCQMFCPPRGKFSRRHLKLVRTAGYLALRSVEMGSLDFPKHQRGVMLMPTTVQTHPHGVSFYANMLKRVALRNLWQYITHGRSNDWPKLARRFLNRAIHRGGVFHLWGHSWELEETGQWQRLDELLRFMSEFAGQVPSLTNGQVCRWYLRRGASAGKALQEAEAESEE